MEDRGPKIALIHDLESGGKAARKCPMNFSLSDTSAATLE